MRLPYYFFITIILLSSTSCTSDIKSIPSDWNYDLTCNDDMRILDSGSDSDVSKIDKNLDIETIDIKMDADSEKMQIDSSNADFDLEPIIECNLILAHNNPAIYPPVYFDSEKSSLRASESITEFIKFYNIDPIIYRIENAEITHRIQLSALIWHPERLAIISETRVSNTETAGELLQEFYNKWNNIIAFPISQYQSRFQYIEINSPDNALLRADFHQNICGFPIVHPENEYYGDSTILMQQDKTKIKLTKLYSRQVPSIQIYDRPTISTDMAINKIIGNRLIGSCHEINIDEMIDESCTFSKDEQLHIFIRKTPNVENSIEYRSALRFKTSCNLQDFSVFIDGFDGEILLIRQNFQC